ncbi:MAG: L-serine ammonia-lyase [Alphaproteobacteria bacterium]
MFISVFDLFKVGIGPSSSHTMGPMLAAARFLERVRKLDTGQEGLHIKASLHGSLAFTGKGHATDRAVMLGLMGFVPASLNPDTVEAHIKTLQEQKKVMLDGGLSFHFDPEEDIIFDYGPPLEGHPNGMIFFAYDGAGAELLRRVYYSVGGGFVVSEEEMGDPAAGMGLPLDQCDVPYPFKNAQEMLEMAAESGLSIAQMKRANEVQFMDEAALSDGLQKIWSVMSACIDRGLSKGGQLPGSLHVKRRAREIRDVLDEEKLKNAQNPHVCNEWLSVYAMAVNEENAAGGQVVTAPTNGAAGVVPAVLRYYLDFIPGAEERLVERFLLTAAAVGGIIKSNASISGAEVGCQGEVGSASAMAAAGLCAVMGGSPAQIENAAEIALEHHLGMTCDPVGGLVQVPCIERNGLGAVKAVTASALALRGDGTHIIPLDNCIETMRQTGMDMSERYKETSKGGLAVNLPEC